MLRMAREQFPSDTQERFLARLPEGMRDRLRASAAVNNRSMNAEIVARLEETFDRGPVAPRPVPEVVAHFEGRLEAVVQEFYRLMSRVERLEREHLVHARIEGMQNSECVERGLTVKDQA